MSENMNNEPSGKNRSSTLTGALILIILGLFFLASNFGWLGFLDGIFGNLNLNWWAFFILIPIVAIGVKLIQNMRESSGQFTKEMQGQVGGLLILTLVFATLLLNWDWGVIWPLFLIAIGLNILLPMLTKND